MPNAMTPFCCCGPVCRDIAYEPDEFSVIAGDNSNPPVSDGSWLALSAGVTAELDGGFPSGDEAYELEIVHDTGTTTGIEVWVNYDLDGVGDPIDGTGTKITLLGESISLIGGPRNFLHTPTWVWDPGPYDLKMYDAVVPINGRLRVTAHESGALRIRYRTATVEFAADAAYDDEPIFDCGIRPITFCSLLAQDKIANSTFTAENADCIVNVADTQWDCNSTFGGQIVRLKADSDCGNGLVEPDHVSANLLFPTNEPSRDTPYPQPKIILTLSFRDASTNTITLLGEYDLGPEGLEDGGTFDLGTEYDVQWDL